MSFEFDSPDTIQGEGGFLNDVGAFHMVVTDVKDGENKKGNPINGFYVGCDTLAGTAESCAGKSYDMSIFKPDLSASEGLQLKSRRQIAAMLLATDLMEPSDLGQPVTVKLEHMVGRQFIVRLKRKMEKDDDGNYTVPTKFLEIDYASIFHVDDPEVKDIPKDPDAIGLIPTLHRHRIEWFDFKAKKGAKAQPAAAASEASDFDDI